MYGMQLQSNDVPERDNKLVEVGEVAEATVRDAEINDGCERGSEREYVGMWSAARPVNIRESKKPYVGKQSARETQWKHMNKRLLLVIRDVEVVEVTVEVSRFSKVDEARDAFVILEVKDLQAVPTFQ